MRLGTALSSLAASPSLPPLWPPLLATRGPGSKSTRHAHHAIHVVVSLASKLRIEMPDGTVRDAPGVLTRPDVPHAIDGSEGGDVLLVFLDPESAAGSALATVCRDAVHFVTAAERERILAAGSDPIRLMSGEGTAWTDSVVRALRERADRKQAPSLPPRRMHPRVRRALNRLRTWPADVDATLESLARIAGLSPGRFMHAFTDSVGIPLRPYLAWLKLQRAAAGLASGVPLGQIAHDAGFADAAHMTRSFRRMFGVTPSQLRSSARATRSRTGHSARSAET